MKCEMNRSRTFVKERGNGLKQKPSAYLNSLYDIPRNLPGQQNEIHDYGNGEDVSRACSSEYFTEDLSQV